MLKKIIFIIGFYLLTQQAYADNSQKEIIKTWDTFLDAVKNENCSQFVKLSSPKIRCYMCMENTEKEYKALDDLRLYDPDWYNKIYKDKIFISNDKFCTDDMKIIFNKKFISILRSNKTVYSKNGNDRYEILVITTKPGEVHPMHEGAQHHFSFKKTKDGFKFIGIGTIP